MPGVATGPSQNPTVGLQVIVKKSRGWTAPLGNVRRGLQVAPGTYSVMAVGVYLRVFTGSGAPFVPIHLISHYCTSLRNISTRLHL
jgi:hypothetical protein